jgi:hypothetical protein
MPPPIILIHRGDSFYLAHTIAQARSSNPESRLILLGDRSNSFYLGVEHHRYEDYFEEAREFSKLFTYEHFPNYQYPWILFCHQKYFALRDFVRSQGISKFLLIDSDVMIYEPVEPYFQYYKSASITLTSPAPGDTAFSAAAGFAIVNDTTILDTLCGIYTRIFSQSLAALSHRWGINCFNEMFGLYLLLSENPERVRNIFPIEAQFVINPSVIDDERFQRKNRLLEISWVGEIPYFSNRETGQRSKSPIIHFHGHAKKVMSDHLKLDRFSLRLQHALNRLMSAGAKYPMRAINRVSGCGIFPGI